MKKIRIGDVFKIPLSDGRNAYGRYIYFDKTMGTMIEVLRQSLPPEYPLTNILKRNDSFRQFLWDYCLQSKTVLGKLLGIKKYPILPIRVSLKTYSTQRLEKLAHGIYGTGPLRR